jgi:sporulation protein YlmC with PRC-barrel domain
MKRYKKRGRRVGQVKQQVIRLLSGAVTTAAIILDLRSRIKQCQQEKAVTALKLAVQRRKKRK